MDRVCLHKCKQEGECGLRRVAGIGHRSGAERRRALEPKSFVWNTTAHAPAVQPPLSPVAGVRQRSTAMTASRKTCDDACRT